jgi:hypothetical protein
MAQVDVLIKKTASGELDEEINFAKDFKKIKKRDLKKKYKDFMKDPSRFRGTRMADSDHAPLFVRKNDTITFFHDVSFRVTFTRDPEIEEDFGEDDSESPFVDAGSGALVVFRDATADTGAPAAGREFFAGPFKRNSKASVQQFYKFSIATAEFLTLDPDIVVEP